MRIVVIAAIDRTDWHENLFHRLHRFADPLTVNRSHHTRWCRTSNPVLVTSLLKCKTDEGTCCNKEGLVPLLNRWSYPNVDDAAWTGATSIYIQDLWHHCKSGYLFHLQWEPDTTCKSVIPLSRYSLLLLSHWGFCDVISRSPVSQVLEVISPRNGTHLTRKDAVWGFMMCPFY